MKEFVGEKTAIEAFGGPLEKVFPIVVTSGAAIGLVYFLAQTHEGFLYVLSNGLPPFLALAALAMAAAGLARNGVRLKDRVSTVWLSFSAGMLLWFLGEFMWAVYALWFSIPVPYPSLADGFWLAGYIPLLCAIMIQAWPFRRFLSSRKMLLVISVVFVLAGLLLVWLIPPAYASAIGADLVSMVVGVAYPLLDVALLLVALPVLFLLGRGTFWRPFLFVTVGLILTFAGDILFSWATFNNAYYDGSFLELFFHWSYLAMAYGFYLRYRNGSGTKMLG